VSSSSSSDSEGSRKRHKKRKEKDRDKHRRTSRERKERKKEKKEKKKRKSHASTSQWGAHGIITEADLYTKEAEFRTWLVEERMLNPETLNKEQTKKQFSKFMEDYNTATLPHEKYYDMESYERRMLLVRSGETLPPDDLYDISQDFAKHSSSHKVKEGQGEVYMSKEQLKELRKVQQERFEIGKMKVLGMDVKTNMGVRMDSSYQDG